MAKTKWIVPAIALVICAASLVGAAYAAYSATLTDSETVNATNNYVTVGDTKNLNATINLEWNTLNDLDTGDITYTLNAQKAKIGTIQITKDDSNIKAGQETVTCSAILTVNSIQKSGVDYPLTGATLKLYTDEGCTSEATMGSLSYSTTYYLALVCDGSFSSTTAPGTLTIAYTIGAQATIINIS